jgi:hypothetical protein
MRLMTVQQQVVIDKIKEYMQENDCLRDHSDYEIKSFMVRDPWRWETMSPSVFLETETGTARADAGFSERRRRLKRNVVVGPKGHIVSVKSGEGWREWVTGLDDPMIYRNFQSFLP